MEENFEFGRIEQILVERATQRKLPVTGGFELTPYCNLACKMCYVKETAPGLPRLSGEQWLEIGKQAAAAGTLGICLTGGEPMVHPDFRIIYQGLKALGIVMTINTNATLIDENMADFLAADMPRRVNISLYGPNREVYEQLCGNGDAFDRTILALELMLNRGIPVKINITPTTINFPYLDDMFAICKQYALTVEMAPYLFESNHGGGQPYRLSPEAMAVALEKWNRYRYDEYEMIAYAMLSHEGLARFEESRKLDVLIPITCRAATSSYCLSWDGGMNACVNLLQPRANVLEKGFAAAWEEVKAFGAEIRVPAKCMSCSLRLFCQNCGAIGFHENGRFETVSQYMCDTTYAYAMNLSKTVQNVQRVTKEFKYED